MEIVLPSELVEGMMLRTETELNRLLPDGWLEDSVERCCYTVVD